MTPLHLLLAFLACGQKDPATDDSDAGTDDTSSELDDTGSEGDDLYAEGCLEAHGIYGADSKWEYHFTNSNKSGKYTVTVDSVDTEANTARLYTNQYWNDVNGINYTSEAWADYFCNTEGLHTTWSRKEFTLVMSTGTDEGFYEYSWDEPQLLRPNYPAMDETWSSVSKGTLTTEDGSESLDYTTEYAVSREDIARTMGRAQQHDSVTSTGVEYSYYWIEGIGLSWDIIISLDSHTP